MNLSDERTKIYTGDIIEGCEEWYWHYSESGLKQRIEELKEKLIPFMYKIEIEKLLLEIFGDKLVTQTSGKVKQ